MHVPLIDFMTAVLRILNQCEKTNSFRMFLESNEGLESGITDNFENHVRMRGILDAFITYP